MSDKPTIAERYLRATEATSLLVKPLPGPVDVLMAAGMSAQGDPMKLVALTLYRMRESGKTGGFDGVCEALTEWLLTKCKRARASMGYRRMRHKVVERVVFWWLNDVCQHCHGRGHPVIPGTPVMDDSRHCQHCNGTGRVPLERIVQQDFAPEAKLLAIELERVSNELFGEAARKLR